MGRRPIYESLIVRSLISQLHIFDGWYPLTVTLFFILFLIAVWLTVYFFTYPSFSKDEKTLFVESLEFCIKVLTLWSILIQIMQSC